MTSASEAAALAFEAECDLRALLGQSHPSPLDLGAPFAVLPSGVYFAPDPHIWGLLDHTEQQQLRPPPGLGEPVLLEGVNPNWLRVLPFPYTAQQLLRFAEWSLLPELCNWMERDLWRPPLRVSSELAALEDRPRAWALAQFLAGGPDPDQQGEGPPRNSAAPRAHGPRQGSKSEMFLRLLAEHPSMPVARVNSLLPAPLDDSTARRLARKARSQR